MCNRGCSIERVMTEHQTGEKEAMHPKKTKQLTKKKCNTEFKKTQRKENATRRCERIFRSDLQSLIESLCTIRGCDSLIYGVGRLSKDDGNRNDYTPEKNDQIGVT